MYLRNKYRAKKTPIDGFTFDSKKEADRYQELKYLQLAGKISNLELQVEYELIPRQVNSMGKVERPVKYIADFRYIESGKTVVEDVKGFRTDTYKIKRKLMLAVHDITIKEA